MSVLADNQLVGTLPIIPLEPNQLNLFSDLTLAPAPLSNGLFGDTRVPSARFEKGFIKVPAAELQETDDAIHLKLELPGLEAKDLDIQVTEDAVHISGERKSEAKTENNGTTKSEFYYGKFQRVIPLSARIQNTNVIADYKDGILNLTLPKSEQEKNKVVKVNLEQPAA